MKKRDRLRRIEKFEELLRVTQDIPTAEFEMGHWYETNCKSSGCLMGHCAHDPYFTKRGISLQAEIESQIETGRPVEVEDEDFLYKSTITYNIVYYKRNVKHPFKGQHAPQYFFNIYGDDVTALFMWQPSGKRYSDKCKAIRKIKTFIKYLKKTPDYGSMPNWKYGEKWDDAA